MDWMQNTSSTRSAHVSHDSKRRPIVMRPQKIVPPPFRVVVTCHPTWWNLYNEPPHRGAEALDSPTDHKFPCQAGGNRLHHKRRNRPAKPFPAFMKGSRQLEVVGEATDTA